MERDQKRRVRCIKSVTQEVARSKSKDQVVGIKPEERERRREKEGERKKERERRREKEGERKKERERRRKG
jgi:hypothetical protein